MPGRRRLRGRLPTDVITGIKRCVETVRHRLGDIWWYTAVLFVVQRIGDLVNIFIGLWLVPRWISQTELGAILPLGQVGVLLGLPLAVVLGVFGKFATTFAAKGDIGKVKALLLDVLALSACLSVLIAGYTYWVSPFIIERMRVGGGGLVWLLSGLAVTSALVPVLATAQQAVRGFRWFAVNALAVPVLRLALLGALLPALGIVGYFSAQLLTALGCAAIFIWALWQVLSPSVTRDSYRQHIREMSRYSIPVLAMTVLGVVQSTTELFVIRHRLPDVESAAYYMISRFAEIPGALWGALMIPFFPAISAHHEDGRDTGRILTLAVVGSLLAGGCVAGMLVWGSGWLLGLKAEWSVYRPYDWLMGVLALRSVVLIPVGCLTVHEMACRRFGYAWFIGGLSLLEAGLLYGLTGVGFFQPYLPESWMRELLSLRACRLEFVTGVMLAYAVLSLLFLLAHMRMRLRRL